MDTNLVGSSSGALTVTTDKFNCLYGGASAWGTAATTQNVMPVAGTLKNFYVKIDTTNPSGKTFAIYKNGVDTAITLTIPNGSTTGNDLSHTVSFVAGDTISVHATGGDGVTSTGIVRWAITATCAANVSMILGGSNAATGTTLPVYMSVSGESLNTAAGSNVEQVIPTNGTISNAYVQLNTAIGAGTNYTFTLVVNGVDSALAFTMNTAVATANDTTHSVSVSAGDRVYWRISTTAVPATKTVFISTQFSPTINGESIHMYGASRAQPTGTTIKYNSLMPVGLTFNATEAPAEVLTQAAVWKKLYIYEQTSIATGSLKYQPQVNGSAAGPSVTISSGQTGNDTSNTVTTSGGDTVSMGVTPTSPTVSLVEWGIVSYIAPPASVNSNFLAFMT